MLVEFRRGQDDLVVSSSIADEQTEDTQSEDEATGAAPSVVTRSGSSSTAEDETGDGEGFGKWLVTSHGGSFPPIIWIVIVVIGGVAAVLVYLSDSDVPSANKARMAIGVGAALLIAISAGAALGHSRSTRIAKAVDSTGLILMVGMIAIAPVLLLDRADQILLLKLGVVLILSLLPGLIYFQFLSARGEALWEEFTSTLRRLDVDALGPLPGPGRLPSEANIYRRKFEATYGRLQSTNTHSGVEAASDTPLSAAVRRGGGTAVFPVFLLTAFLAIGWVAVLEPEEVGSVRLFGGFESTGEPGLSWIALQFGFAGAYFFIVQMLIRRYFQNDLTADAYLNGVMRLVVTVITTATIAFVFDMSETQLAATAFVIGVFPEAGVDLLRTAVVFPLQMLIKQHRVQYPLHDLDGMNIWYEARLLEEGIEDIQNLKTTSWVQLLLNTRIPAGRLVDWVDQAHLLLHVDPPRSARGEDANNSDRALLRKYGVRTATDLEAVFYSARKDRVLPRQQDSGASRNDVEQSIETILDGTGCRNRVTHIVRALAAEPVLVNVRAWKRQRAPSSFRPPVGLSSVEVFSRVDATVAQGLDDADPGG